MVAFVLPLLHEDTFYLQFPMLSDCWMCLANMDSQWERRREDSEVRGFILLFFSYKVFSCLLIEESWLPLKTEDSTELLFWFQ